MSKNVKYGNIANGVSLAMAVQANTKAGDVVPVGAGARGYAITPANSDGKATVRLLPTELVVELTISGTAAVGDPIYGAQNSSTGVVTYTKAAASYFVGFVTAISGTTAEVFLGGDKPADLNA